MLRKVTWGCHLVTRLQFNLLAGNNSVPLVNHQQWLRKRNLICFWINSRLGMACLWAERRYIIDCLRLSAARKPHRDFIYCIHFISMCIFSSYLVEYNLHFGEKMCHHNQLRCFLYLCIPVVGCPLLVRAARAHFISLHKLASYHMTPWPTWKRVISSGIGNPDCSHEHELTSIWIFFFFNRETKDMLN